MACSWQTMYRSLSEVEIVDFKHIQIESESNVPIISNSNCFFRSNRSSNKRENSFRKREEGEREQEKRMSKIGSIMNNDRVLKT